MKTKNIIDPVFKYGIVFIKGGNLNTAINKFHKITNIPKLRDQVIEKIMMKQTMGRFYTITGYKTGLIWLREDATIQTIVHECFHATAYLMEVLNIQLQENTEEIFAYYLDFLVGELTNDF